MVTRKDINKMSKKKLLADKLREIIEQAHMAGYNECCDRSPSAYEARIYCNSVELNELIFWITLEAEQLIKHAKLDLIDEILAMQFEGSAIVSVEDIIKIKEKL